MNKFLIATTCIFALLFYGTLVLFINRTEPQIRTVEKTKIVENSHKIDSLERQISTLKLKKLSNYKVLEKYIVKYKADTIIKPSADTVIIYQDSIIDNLEAETIEYSKALYTCKENSKLQADIAYNDSIEIEKYKIKQKSLKKQRNAFVISTILSTFATVLLLLK